MQVEGSHLQSGSAISGVRVFRVRPQEVYARARKLALTTGIGPAVSLPNFAGAHSLASAQDLP